MLVKTISTSELADLRKVFEGIDTDHSGIISRPELEEALKKVNF